MLGKITSGVGNKIVVLLSNELARKLTFPFLRKLLGAPIFISSSLAHHFNKRKNIRVKSKKDSIGKITDIIGTVHSPYLVVTLSQSQYSKERISKNKLMGKVAYTAYTHSFQ
jgi:rRNA processing protein Gar1